LTIDKRSVVYVMPAKAGIQFLDSGLRRNDKKCSCRYRALSLSKSNHDKDV